MKVFYLLISIEIFSSLLLNEDLYSFYNDISKCMTHDKYTCTEVELETKGFQCCTQRVLEKYDNKKHDEDYMCLAPVNPINIGKKEMETENGKIILKEVVGKDLFTKEEKSNIISQDIQISCKDDNIQMFASRDNFTQEEKERFKSDKLCIKFFLSDAEEDINNTTCFDSIVATAGKNSGVSCGFFEFTLNFDDNTNSHFNTCLLFNDDIIKNKNIGYWTKLFSLSSSMEKTVKLGKSLSSFMITFSNSKGNKLKYDSSTDKIIDGDSEPDTTDPTDSRQSSNYLAYKYLSFLIILLIEII